MWRGPETGDARRRRSTPPSALGGMRNGKRSGERLRVRDVGVAYSGRPAVAEVSMDIHRNDITALIGPSGCGKSTLLRSLNRMNDLIPTASVSGTVLYHDQDLYGPDVDPVEVRKRIGMVFQKPNPFPKSIKDNVAFGPKILGASKDIEERGRAALCGAAPLGRGEGPPRRATRSGCPAASSSGSASPAPCGRARRDPDGRAVLGARPDRDRRDRGPDDRPEGALHDRDRHPQHAAGRAGLGHDRVLHRSRTSGTPGRLVEYDETERIFTNPADERTEDYVSGKVG